MKKNEYGAALDRNGYAASIMQENKKAASGQADSLEKIKKLLNSRLEHSDIIVTFKYREVGE